MIDAEQLKDRISLDMILELMEYWDVPYSDTLSNDEQITFSTNVCHGGEHFKLQLFKDSLEFYCYSSCGKLDIISLAQEAEGLDFKEATQWLADYFDLTPKKGKFGRERVYKAPKKREFVKKEVNLNDKQKEWDSSILNSFFPYYPTEWINEGISIETMKKFEITFDINTNAIIIPSRDIEGRLIGIRCRNLNEDNIEKYGKYIVYTDPITHITYKFKSSMVLYGLYANLKAIKKHKKLIIVEGEKSVLKVYEWLKDDCIAVASNGSTISDYHIELIKTLDIEELIVAFDYEKDEKLLKKFEKQYKKCALHFKTSIMDYELMSELLDEKENLTDKGKEVFDTLIRNRRVYSIE